MTLFATETSTRTRVLRLLEKGFRATAIDRALNLTSGRACDIRREATAAGKVLPVPSHRNRKTVSVDEYQAVCRAAGITPDPDFQEHPSGISVTGRDDTPWPHRIHYPDPPARNAEALAQAVRITDVARRLPYVPAMHAGGGELHFARECAEHLAALVAFAPGPRYPEDPRAVAQRVRRMTPERPLTHSPCGSPLAPLIVGAV